MLLSEPLTSYCSSADSTKIANRCSHAAHYHCCCSLHHPIQLSPLIFLCIHLTVVFCWVSSTVRIWVTTCISIPSVFFLTELLVSHSYFYQIDSLRCKLNSLASISSLPLPDPDNRIVWIGKRDFSFLLNSNFFNHQRYFSHRIYFSHYIIFSIDFRGYTLPCLFSISNRTTVDCFLYFRILSPVFGFSCGWHLIQIRVFPLPLLFFFCLG